jgi:hypothetical protein
MLYNVQIVKMNNCSMDMCIKSAWIVIQSFMLGWPCIMNYMYNNQLDALFILSLLN